MTTLCLAMAAAAVFASPAAASTPSTRQLQTHLRDARQRLLTVREHARQAAANAAGARELRTLIATSTTPVTPPASMNQALATRLLADAQVTNDEVAAVEARARRLETIAHRWSAHVRRLARLVRRQRLIDEWARRGTWRPLIEIAGRRYGIRPSGLYRMMMLESGGRRYAGTTFKGLYQYCPSTWSASWNPWRHESIFNGWAQIRATAYAIDKGMGPSQWPNTYPMAF